MIKTFKTRAEASAFLSGVEYVNDSAITAYVSELDPCTVVVLDTDEDEDVNDDPSGALADALATLFGTAP